MWSVMMIIMVDPWCGVAVPWWLNLHCRRPDSVEMRIQEEAMPSGSNVFGGWPFVRAAVYDQLPINVRKALSVLSISKTLFSTISPMEVSN